MAKCRCCDYAVATSGLTKTTPVSGDKGDSSVSGRALVPTMPFFFTHPLSGSCLQASTGISNYLKPKWL